MLLKAGYLLVTLFVGITALPVQDDQDMSIFFENTGPSARILGGEPAGRASFMVALTVGENVRNLLCGGSLITCNRVLTAAHCVSLTRPTLRGHVGTDRYASGGYSFSFSKSVIHPNYDGRLVKNDISVLYTESDVPLSSSVSIIAPGWDFVGAGTPTIAYGWGQTSTNASVSQVLLELPARVINGTKCVRLMAEHATQNGIGLPPVDPRVEICTFNSIAHGMCRGDSGGPLIRANRRRLIGIVSWGLPCAQGVPDIFSRVSAFRSFILENIA